MINDLPKSLIEAAKAIKVDVKKNTHDVNLRKREKEIAASHKANVKEEVKQVDEALKGGQHKLDVDKDGKLEKSDFKKLRSKKTNEEVQFSDKELARIQEIIGTDK